MINEADRFKPATIIAREHIAWCIDQGMTPNDVCESVLAYLTDPTWSDAIQVIKKRWGQMQRGVEPLPIITDRNAA